MLEYWKKFLLGGRSDRPPDGDPPSLPWTQFVFAHHSNIPAFHHSSEVTGHIFMNTANTRIPFFVRHAAAALLLGSLVGLLQTGCATGGAASHSPDPAPRAVRSALRERWGIEVTSLHLSANGRMVDFRYRVLDSKKAALLGDRNLKPTLTDLATGAVLRVPSFPKTGSMRQTGAKMEEGRIYFMLFANTGMPVKVGSRVTVTVGGFKAENLIVQ